MKQVMKVLVMLVIVLVVLSGRGELTGQASAASDKGPREVGVGLYLLSMGKLDITSGTFNVDFYLTLKDTQPIEDKSFEVMNGRVSKQDLIETKNDSDGKFVKIYRIIATQSTKTDLRKFPFDQQSLPIVVESTQEDNTQVKYVPIADETGIDADNSFPGWTIKGWSTKVNEHNYTVFNQQYSQYVFSVDITKIWFNSFIKTFLPVLFTILITLVIFIIAPDKVTTRLEIICSLLVAIAMFHISIFNQLPPVSYATVADEFMFLTYFILLACICLNVYIYKLLSSKDSRMVSFDRKAKVGLFSCVPAAYIVFFVFLI
ncbi:hypothetical protein [Paenibacillus cremeus]|uniref:Neurotransmitter-gated ion-channel ligand-binding domain-containing protein n=1 Tax=Paenibacillus cremeus TaxID=2163881 RepID=A0A559JZV0_9BACL|nr:hypothetical protein [Paenibacillus cremeus]TVY05408.1 hypothetical protein FPZ49_30260 [Paenibacillus cremeus]